VIMAGGTAETPMNCTTFGWRSEAISPHSFCRLNRMGLERVRAASPGSCFVSCSEKRSLTATGVSCHLARYTCGVGVGVGVVLGVESKVGGRGGGGEQSGGWG
jgi:hypothetical protein